MLKLSSHRWRDSFSGCSHRQGHGRAGEMGSTFEANVSHRARTCMHGFTVYGGGCVRVRVPAVVGGGVREGGGWEADVDWLAVVLPIQAVLFTLNPEAAAAGRDQDVGAHTPRGDQDNAACSGRCVAGASGAAPGPQVHVAAPAADGASGERPAADGRPRHASRAAPAGGSRPGRRRPHGFLSCARCIWQ